METGQDRTDERETRPYQGLETDDRATLVLSMLNKAKVEPTEPEGRMTFATNVCDRCYVEVIIYLQRQFKIFKGSILSMSVAQDGTRTISAIKSYHMHCISISDGKHFLRMWVSTTPSARKMTPSIENGRN